jgi:hypothetical protein
MGWRGPAALVLLIAIGVIGGYAGAQTWQDEPDAAGVAEPVAATSPSVPVDPAPVILPDPEAPALEPDLPTHEEVLGSGGFTVTVPVPDGWNRTDLGPAEARWGVPDIPLHTYVLRVEQVTSQRESIDSILTDRIADLDGTTEDLVVVDQTSDSLEFTYLSDGYLRFGFLRWLDLTGSGHANLEIAVTGREQDVEGARALVETVAEGAHR